jgi:dienelactone hydrolase
MRSSIFRLPLLLLVGCVVSVAACSEDDDVDDPYSNDPTSSTGAQGGAGSGGATASGIQARFELPASGAPDFLAVPFPSDLYRDATGLVTDIPGMDAYVPNNAEFLAAGMAGLDGFGTTAGAIFAIDDETGEAPELDAATLPADDAASLADDATAMLVDLDAASAADARVRARVVYHDDRPIEGKMRPHLVVYPGRGVALQPGHRYAAVLTTGIESKSGDPLAPSAAFAAIADGSKRDTDAEKLYGGAVDELGALVPALADTDQIAALALYTTSTNRRELAELRAELGALPVPVLSWEAAELAPMGRALFANAPLPAGFVATLDQWLGAPADLPTGVDDPANDQTTGKAHDALAAVGTAVFNAPNLLREGADYDDVVHHTFARDASGKAIVNPDKPTNKVWVTVALPIGAVPATGFPAVVIQHGLGGDRSYLLSMANTFAKRGWATVAIESVTFGARSADPATGDAVSGFEWSTTSGYDGPDGFVDDPASATAFFGSLKNLGALRDQMRQSVLDIGTLVEVLRNPALNLEPLLQAVPGAHIDASRLAYLGNSLGGIMGAMHAAIDPHVSTYVLNVAGGGLLTELSNGPIIAGQIKLANTVNFGTVGNVRFAPGHPMLQLMQHVVDLGDPLAYAHHIVLEPATVGTTVNPPKNVLQIEALWDEWVSNEANEALAFAAGFPLAVPNLGPRTGLPFVEAMPNASGEISGVPLAGVTAVLVQSGPATHGGNLHDKQGTHNYAYPWPRWEEEAPFPQLEDQISIALPYLATQAAATDFIGSAFLGGPPVVKGFTAPANDFDGDGALDADDADPNDPAVN